MLSVHLHAIGSKITGIPPYNLKSLLFLTSDIWALHWYVETILPNGKQTALIIITNEIEKNPAENERWL